MWEVKSIQQKREDQRIRKQEIEAYEPPFIYNVIGHMVFLTVMILGGFILGLVWAAMENKS